MKKKSDAKVEANVRIYLVPENEYKEVNGKPVLDNKHLVYEGKRKNNK
jgi:hypothetical protein